MSKITDEELRYLENLQPFTAVLVPDQTPINKLDSSSDSPFVESASPPQVAISRQASILVRNRPVRLPKGTTPEELFLQRMISSELGIPIPKFDVKKGLRDLRYVASDLREIEEQGRKIYKGDMFLTDTERQKALEYHLPRYGSTKYMALLGGGPHSRPMKVIRTAIDVIPEQVNRNLREDIESLGSSFIPSEGKFYRRGGKVGKKVFQ